jgi:hypothetical protein
MKKIKSQVIKVKATSTRKDEVGEIVSIGSEYYYVLDHCVEEHVNYTLLYQLNIAEVNAWTHIRIMFIGIRYMLGL